MKKHSCYTKLLIIFSSIAGLETIILITTLIIRSIPNVAENFSKTISRSLIIFIAQLTANLNFTLTEIFIINYSLILLALIIIIIINFVKKNSNLSITFIPITLVIALIVPTSFMLTQGVSYNRLKIDIPQYQEKVKQSEYKNVAKFFIDDCNKCINALTLNQQNEIVTQYTLEEIGNIINKEYQKLNNDYLSDANIKIKPLLFSPLFTQMHITGVTFAPLGDVGINVCVPNYSLPFTIAHEIAHIKGAQREEDAQLIAMYITLNSTNAYVKYSGYYATISSAISLTKYTGNKQDYEETKKLIDPKILANINYNNDFWNKNSLLVPLANFVNNLFLKSNGEEGTSSYDDKSIIDPVTGDIKIYSRYQKLFFHMYFNK